MQQACPSQQGWDPSCWHTQVKAAAAAVAPLPFLLTEYNVGCCLGYPQHDTSVGQTEPQYTHLCESYAQTRHAKKLSKKEELAQKR